MSGSSRPLKSSCERLLQHVLVALLHVLADPRAQGFGGPYAAGQLELAEVLGVGIPDPLHDVRDPGFGAVVLQAAAPGSRWRRCSGGRKSRPRCRSRGACGRGAAAAAEAVAAAHHGVAQRSKLHARLHGRCFERARTDRPAIPRRRLRYRRGIPRRGGASAAASATGRRTAGRASRCARRASASVPRPVVGVLAGGREDLHGCVAVRIQDVAQVGRVLAEAAGALGGGHEEGHARRDPCRAARAPS